MTIENLETENQMNPLCPWCGEEFEADELEMDFVDLIRDDKHPSILMRCPYCDQLMEISTTFVYSTYKGERDDVDF